MKSLSLLTEYPTPAGLSINNKLVRLSHENGFTYRFLSDWYDAFKGNKYGATYCNKPIFDAHPGPPFIQTVTGNTFLAPL